MEKDEIWKDIFGYENIYQVSNLGRVRGLKRKTGNSTGYYIRKGKILKKAMNIHGYEFVILSKNGKRKTITVHRLVAEAFIPNPNHFPCINHKNENRACNIVENLEWCTHKYNSNYGTSQKRKVMAISKPIIQMDLKECEIQTFSS